MFPPIYTKKEEDKNGNTESQCIRCGKVRIFKSRWREKLDKGAAITHTRTVCPDSDCQKIVDSEFEEKRAKRELLENRKTQVKI